MRHVFLGIFLFFYLFSVGCNKPVPDPENIDPIYADLQREKGAVEGNISSLEKQLTEFEGALKNVVPQTGQIKYAQKRVDETKAQINKQKQMLEFLKVHIESRKKLDRESYLRAFHKKQPWPDPKEYEAYLNQKKMTSLTPVWSAKKRVEAYQQEIKQKNAPPAGGGH